MFKKKCTTFKRPHKLKIKKIHFSERANEMKKK